MPVSAALIVPIPSTNHTLHVGWAYSATGLNVGASTLCQQVIELCIDTINSRGGLTIAGQKYGVSLTQVSDDSSVAYAQVLYKNFASQSTPYAYDSYFTDFSSPMSASAANGIRSAITNPANYPPFFAPGTAVPAVMGGYPGFTGPRTSACYIKSVFDQLFASQKGVKTVAVAWRATDTYSLTYAAAVQTYLAARNFPTSSLTLIPVTFTIGIQDVQQYTTIFTNQLPYNTDVLILISQPNEVPNFVAGLTASGKTPGFAVYGNVIDDSNAALMAAADGWVETTEWLLTEQITATVPNGLFQTNSEFITAFRSRYGFSPARTHALTQSNCEAFTAGYQNSPSTNLTDVRNTISSLNGVISVGNLKFDSIGSNVASGCIAAQAISGKMYNIADLPLFPYPHRWYWTPLSDGDQVNYMQNGPVVTLAVFLSILGCWIALLYMEQVIHLRKVTSNSSASFMVTNRWRFGLLIIGGELSGTAIWCMNFVSVSTLTFFNPSSSGTSDLTVSYGLGWALLAWIPMYFTMILGLLLALPTRAGGGGSGVEAQGDTAVEGTTSGGGSGPAASRYAVVQRVKQDKERTTAALNSLTDEIQMIWETTNTLRTLLSSVFIYATLLLSRFFCQWSVNAKVHWNVSIGGAVGGSILCYFLITISMRIYSDGIRLRVPAAFLLAATFVMDYQIYLSSVTFTYAPSLTFTSSLSTQVILSSSTISIICSAFAAFAGVCFIGLQFSRMKLSRNALALTLTRMEINTKKLQEKNQKLEWECEKWSELSDLYQRQIEIINYVTPAHIDNRNYALALAQTSNRSTALNPVQVQLNDLNEIQLDSDGQIQSSTLAKLLATNNANSIGRSALNKTRAINTSNPTSANNLPEESVASGNVRSSLDRKGAAIQSEWEAKALSNLSRIEANSSNSEAGPFALINTGKLINDSSTSLPVTSSTTSTSCSRSDFARFLPRFLCDPICIEIIKDELNRLHSVENIMFYLDARRYGTIRSGELRKKMAIDMYRIYIQEGAKEQVNISFNLVQAIKAALLGTNNAPSTDLFASAAQEVLKLITTNLTNLMNGTPVFRLCLQIIEGNKTGLLGGAEGGNGSVGVDRGTMSVNGNDCDNVNSPLVTSTSGRIFAFGVAGHNRIGSRIGFSQESHNTPSAGNESSPVASSGTTRPSSRATNEVSRRQVSEFINSSSPVYTATSPILSSEPLQLSEEQITEL